MLILVIICKHSHFGVSVSDNGNQEIEHHYKVNKGAEDEENPDCNYLDLSKLFSVEVAQTDSVGVDEAHEWVSYEALIHCVSKVDAVEGVREGEDGDRKDDQEGSHVVDDSEDHADDVGSDVEDPHEVEELEPHEQRSEGVDRNFERHCS